MVAAVRVHKTGEPDALTYEDIEVPPPGPGQLRIKQHACGVNFIDTYFRSGAYPPPPPQSPPFVAGNEGAGEVVAGRPRVPELQLGDRAADAAAPAGDSAVRMPPARRSAGVPVRVSSSEP